VTVANRESLPADLEAHFCRHRSRFRHELFEFLRIPSVSAREEHLADVVRAAEWLVDSLRACGLATELHVGRGHPIVLGEWRGAPAGAPTVHVERLAPAGTRVDVRTLASAPAWCAGESEWLLAAAARTGEAATKRPRRQT
jgi:hypothetical protein